MIPFRVAVSTATSPVVTMSLIVINIAVYFIQLGLSPRKANEFIATYALVPAVYGHPAAARAYGFDPTNLLPILSNTFMHGGALHLIVNMWTLWLFGLPVEDRLGPWRFLLFYLTCGAAGSIAHLLFNLDSVVPALGASGAIAGVLGGFTRFHPRAKVAVVQPIFFIFPLIFHLPAVIFTGIWFLFQILGGWSSWGDSPTGGGIAWWAHIGGFAAGLAIALWLTRRPRQPRRRGPWSRR
ncbi:MAG: rhomboid family intramembrane serine protease [Rhodospirillales bacterium]|nr:rhomboid family intramembrane serine protease [Rhodospirillales bacterium]